MYGIFNVREGEPQSWSDDEGLDGMLVAAMLTVLEPMRDTNAPGYDMATVESGRHYVRTDDLNPQRCYSAQWGHGEYNAALICDVLSDQALWLGHPGSDEGTTTKLFQMAYAARCDDVVGLDCDDNGALLVGWSEEPSPAQRHRVNRVWAEVDTDSDDFRVRHYVIGMDARPWSDFMRRNTWLQDNRLCSVTRTGGHGPGS